MQIDIHKKYPAKLLLFGEHSIIQGSCALALPYDVYCGGWCESKTEDGNLEEKIKSRSWLYRICDQLRVLKAQNELKSSIDVKKFEENLENGLWFDSNIPLGYGLGSSGAVCAAIYDTFGNPTANGFERLQEELAQLENFFHGKSSGIDPLTCYLEKLLLITEEKKIIPREFPTKFNDKGTLFLIDTHTPRSTAPLVNYFVEQCKQEAFLRDCVEPLKKSTREAVYAFLKGDAKILLQATKNISALQYKYFPPMILPQHREIWKQGLESGLYALKLCGAGGGGFMLGITEDWESTQKQLATYQRSVVLEYGN